MDLGSQTLLSVAVLLLMNNALMRFQSLAKNSGVYVGIQVMNLAVACYIIVLGMPGFRNLPAISWMLGLLLIYHTVQNVRVRRTLVRHAREEAAVEARRKEIHAALGEAPRSEE